mmetsp:Transcript_5746/g.8381  ORF Transcript_5746/g.8381 Transcript_5746/m.8381 type:complete len:143 (+) Transcript_5746:306-734(+)
MRYAFRKLTQLWLLVDDERAVVIVIVVILRSVTSTGQGVTCCFDWCAVSARGGGIQRRDPAVGSAGTVQLNRSVEYSGRCTSIVFSKERGGGGGGGVGWCGLRARSVCRWLVVCSVLLRCRRSSVMALCHSGAALKCSGKSK